MKKIVFLGLAILMFSCSPQIMVDYLTVSVPQESGIKLTQYTKESDNVCYPVVAENPLTKKLLWYAPTLIAVSPDGKKIAYTCVSNNYKNLYLKDIGGGGSVIQRTFNREIYDMSYSPDGKYIAFTERNSIGDDNIYMINATEGAAIQQLVATNADELSPSFAPDGKNVFFAKSEGVGGKYYIRSINIETSLLTQYTEGFTPCITPDGENVIMTRNNKDDQRGEIWMFNIKTGTETMILNDTKKGFSSPQISPDGKHIVCVGNTPADNTIPQNLDLYMVNIDGTRLTQLTFHGGNDDSPVWTPDGKSIFFLSQRGNKDGKYNVWKMDLTNIY